MSTSQSLSESELDKRVIHFFQNLAPADPSDPNSWILVHLISLLRAIVRSSNGKLDNKYSDDYEAMEAINTNEGLGDSLIAAWNEKSFANIRDLDFLKPLKPQSQRRETEIDLDDEDLLRRLALSFRTTYYGVAVDGFYEYLTENEASFKKASDTPYYAKFCSIVQSSGTGKSRVFTELHKKDVIVIYMNLRPTDDKRSFPARDLIPSKILTPDPPPSRRTYQIICYAFFAALFDTLAEYLSLMKGKSAVMRWVSQMCDLTQLPKHPVRDAFFDKLDKNYQTIYTELRGSLHEDDPDTAGDSSHSKTADEAEGETDTGIGETTEQFKKLKISESLTSNRVRSAIKNVAECLDRIFPDPVDKDKPKLVIEFDEAHPLSSTQGSYRPADILCRVVSNYSDGTKGKNSAVWVVFASTTSKVADFSPPNHKYNSDRVSVQGQKLFPPYTQLGWDQNAWRVTDTPIRDISKLDYILGFGRPLWSSLKTSLSEVDLVLDTASYKLLGANKRFDARKTSHVLAVLGQRFGLDVSFGHPDSVAHLEEGVASHLRICLATTVDRSWRFTSYPSEPLLSCVAARILHATPEHLGDSLGTLLKVVHSGMINIGEQGELVSRLLWLLAKDLYIRTRAKDVNKGTPTKWEDHMIDCTMIPVVDWLEFVFGSQVWQTKGARTAFEDAYVNFSHWISMEGNIGGTKKRAELGLQDFTKRHWYRTSAVQCCHQQPLIDKMIPIYFNPDRDPKPQTAASGTAMRQGVSQILISDKARQSHVSKSALTSITRTHESIRGDSDLGDPLPYIAILADFCQSPGFTVTFPESARVADRALRIHAKGMDEKTYPFLVRYPAVAQVFRDLVRLQQSPEINKPVRQHLGAQVKFGTTPKLEHMLWERGKEAPEVKAIAGGSASG